MEKMFRERTNFEKWPQGFTSRLLVRLPGGQMSVSNLAVQLHGDEHARSPAALGPFHTHQSQASLVCLGLWSSPWFLSHDSGHGGSKWKASSALK